MITRPSVPVFRAVRLSRKGVLSTQVLQEYFVSAVRKLGVPATVARRKVEIFSRFELIRIDFREPGATILDAPNIDAFQASHHRRLPLSLCLPQRC